MPLEHLTRTTCDMCDAKDEREHSNIKTDFPPVGWGHLELTVNNGKDYLDAEYDMLICPDCIKKLDKFIIT